MSDVSKPQVQCSTNGGLGASGRTTHPAVSSLDACTTPARIGQWPYCILDKGQASYDPKQKRPGIRVTAQVVSMA